VKRVLIGAIAVNTGCIVLADPEQLHDFDSHTQNLPDLLPPGCPDLNHMFHFPAPELPFSREACWVAMNSLRRGGILGHQHGSEDPRFGKAIAVATEGDGIVPVYLELEDDVDHVSGESDEPAPGIARIVVDLAGPPAQPEQRRGTRDAILELRWTGEDVAAIAEEHGVKRDVALERARSWAKHIGETASTMVNEQLTAAIVHDQP
jgi:hypothetical protein